MTTGSDLATNVREALQRLLLGEPRNEALREKAGRGLNILSISSVAQEAGVSRTSIGHANCPYPELRLEIIDAIAKQKKAPISQKLVDNLRAEIRDLRRQLKLRDVYLAELVLEGRVEKTGSFRPTPSGENVTQFRRDRRKK